MSRITVTSDSGDGIEWTVFRRAAVVSVHTMILNLEQKVLLVCLRAKYLPLYPRCVRVSFPNIVLAGTGGMLCTNEMKEPRAVGRT